MGYINTVVDDNDDEDDDNNDVAGRSLRKAGLAEKYRIRSSLHFS